MQFLIDTVVLFIMILFLLIISDRILLAWHLTTV